MHIALDLFVALLFLENLEVFVPLWCHARIHIYMAI